MIGPSKTFYEEESSDEEKQPSQEQKPEEMEEEPMGINRTFLEMGIPV